MSSAKWLQFSLVPVVIVCGKPTLSEIDNAYIWVHLGFYSDPNILATATLYRAVSRFAPSQWETVLLCGDVSHWLGANLESALSLFYFLVANIPLTQRTSNLVLARQNVRIEPATTQLSTAPGLGPRSEELRSLPMKRPWHTNYFHNTIV